VPKVAADSHTPLFRQYYALKEEHGDAVLMFRLGDFYEMFGPDAERASRVLGITLTSRALNQKTKVPMCGVPHHSVQRYIRRLLEAGLTVAVADQMEDPAQAKGIVRRDVVRLITPGTVIEDELLDAGAANYLAVVAKLRDRLGFAVLESSGGSIHAGESPYGDAAMVCAEIAGRAPKELKIPPDLRKDPAFSELLARIPENAVSDCGEFPSPADLEYFVERQFKAPVAALGMEGRHAAMQAVFEVVRTLRYNFKVESLDLSFVPLDLSDHMVLDAHTLANLEVLEGLSAGGECLLDVFAAPRTAMGRRQIREWLRAPLRDAAMADARLDAVSALVDAPEPRGGIASALSKIVDIERIANRASFGKTNPKELAALRDALGSLGELSNIVSGIYFEAEAGADFADDAEGAPACANASLLPAIASRLAERPSILDKLSRVLAEDPPADPGQGGVVREGYLPELDELRNLKAQAAQWMTEYESAQKERLGIKSLKVKYTPAFGWSIEVTKPNLHLVPGDYVRKQTMVAAERFTTPELTEHETKLATAEEKSLALEKEIFSALVKEVAGARDRLLEIADAIKTLDVLVSFAETAERERWRRPELSDAPGISLSGARHPSVERSVGRARYVANDCMLDSESQQIIVLTGPNMGGKSTYLRMVALCVILAQAGSFVPAQSARIGIVDRVFTRIGAADALAQGRSTFMVEMVETAEILRSATRRSLVILDEVGRGTGTYDGLSIARAVVEYLHNHKTASPLTLFATHYFELTELEKYLPRVRNFRMDVLKESGDFVFLYSVSPGAANESYGIEVARLAGLPHGVVTRARKVLEELEDVKRSHLKKAREIMQMGLFDDE
jgi:DNA mismatch repair protein MutS